MKLSIILCVYNTKIEYVEQCLASVFSSTADDFEVIFVDDGSALDYSPILEKYPVKYTKTKNGGLFKARLVGIEMASGKYVAFVDSDDKISRNYHRPMIDAAERCCADIVFNDWAFDFGSFQNYPTRDTTMKKSISCCGDDVLSFYTSQRGREQSYFVQWNKLFLRELLLSSMAEFAKFDISSKNITYAEDVIFNFFNFKGAKKIINVHTGFYFYRIHAEQSVSVADFSKLKWQIDSMIYAFSLMENNIGENKNASAIRADIFAWREHMARFHYGCAKELNDNAALEYVAEKYEMKKPALPRKNDEYAYKRLEFIGGNFDKTDRILTELYFNGPKDVRYVSRAKYIKRFLNYISTANREESRESAACPKKKRVVLKNKITLKQKILSSYIGPFLSRLYSLLKRIKGGRRA